MNVELWFTVQQFCYTCSDALVTKEGSISTTIFTIRRLHEEHLDKPDAARTSLVDYLRVFYGKGGTDSINSTNSGGSRWLLQVDEYLNQECPNPVLEVHNPARFSVLPGTCVHLPGGLENPQGLDLGTPSESPRGALSADTNMTETPIDADYTHICLRGAAPEWCRYLIG